MPPTSPVPDLRSVSTVVETFLLQVLLRAAFPRLAHRLRFVDRLGPRGLAVYVGANTIWMFAVHAWLMPGLHRLNDRREAVRWELTVRLNREPTSGEIAARLAERHPRG